MRQIRYISVEQRPRGVFAQILAFIAGIGLIVASVVLGAFLLAALLGFALIVGIALSARLWWLRRQMVRQQKAADDEVIETEYTVIDSGERKNRRP